VFASSASADAMQVSRIEPNHAWRETATLEVNVFGTGFVPGSILRFVVAGTDNPGGIRVDQVRVSSPRELVARIKLDASAVPGEFDVEVVESAGVMTRAKSVFIVEPYSWSARFGCTGAETWRRRVPCRRGFVD
jgi:hypothetical protein